MQNCQKIFLADSVTDIDVCIPMITAYEYTYKGNISKMTDPLNGMTTYTYGAANCVPCGGGANTLASLTDAKGQATSWQYDLAGQLIGEIKATNS